MSAQVTHINGSAKGDPQHTIERTRSELFNYLADPSEGAEQRARTRAGTAGDATDDEPGARERTGAIDWAAMLQTGISAWWREHPLRAGAQVIKPGIEELVRNKPLQTVAIAAAVGAGLVLARPWRLVSISAIALSLYRTSNLAGMASSLLYTATQSMQKDTDESTH